MQHIYQKNFQYKPLSVLRITLLGIIAATLVLFAGGWVATMLRDVRIPSFSGAALQSSTSSPQTVFDTPVIPLPAGTSALLTGAKWVPQTFNNCAPATTAMVLQYFGITRSQAEIRARIRTNPDDKNVFTFEIADYLKKEHHIDSKLMYGGDVGTLKKLLSNGYYVIIEAWLRPNNGVGHTSVIRGFDDVRGVFIADDSFSGINTLLPYEQFDKRQWKAFNRTYMPVYRNEKEPLLRAILGENWDEKRMYQSAVQKARAEIAQNEHDMYAWFNLGSSLYELKEYAGAKAAFETSRAIGWPARMLWYQIQPVQTYNALGEYDKALELVALGLKNNGTFAELHYEAAVAYKGLGNIDKARAEIKKALLYAPNLKQAQDLLNSL